MKLTLLLTAGAGLRPVSCFAKAKIRHCSSSYKIWKIKMSKSGKITNCLLLCSDNIIFALHNNCNN